MLHHLVHQPAHVGAFDADAVNLFWPALRAKEIDLGLPRAGDVDVGRFMIERVDHEPETVGAVDYNHACI